MKDSSVFKLDLFADDVCLVTNDMLLSWFRRNWLYNLKGDIHSSLLFNLNISCLILLNMITDFSIMKTGMN